jgi:hypothetical protein
MSTAGRKSDSTSSEHAANEQLSATANAQANILFGFMMIFIINSRDFE